METKKSKAESQNHSVNMCRNHSPFRIPPALSRSICSASMRSDSLLRLKNRSSGFDSEQGDQNEYDYYDKHRTPSLAGTASGFAASQTSTRKATSRPAPFGRNSSKSSMSGKDSPAAFAAALNGIIFSLVKNPARAWMGEFKKRPVLIFWRMRPANRRQLFQRQLFQRPILWAL